MKPDDFHELLRRAIAGDRQAKDEILQLYMPLIDRNSIVDGRLDEDLRQYLLMQAARSIRTFRI